MGISTFGGLNTAFSGVTGSQRNLDITSKNIANAGTEGYSRQRVEQQGQPGARVGLYGDPLAPPGGVEILRYSRVRDQLLDRRLYDQLPQFGDADARKTYLDGLEGFFAEPSDHGVGAQLTSFFNAFREASNNPTSGPARQAVIDRAKTLATSFNDAARQFDRIDAQVQAELTSRLGEINQYATEIEALTKEIRVALSHDEMPNDLQDQRDVLLDKLAELGNITVTKSDDGNIDVTFGTFALITGGVPATAAAADMNTATTGRVFGLRTLTTTTLPSLRGELDAIASAMIGAVNAQHAAGFDLTGAAGGAVFTGTNIATIAVDAAWAADPGRIAMANAPGAVGNGQNGLAIANLIDQTGLVGTQSLRGAYSSFVSTLGVTVETAGRDQVIQAALSDTIRDKRDGVSGVSLDEEMSNLIRFQTGYGAAARAVTAMDEMLQTLVTRMGRVGL